ncbi:MAG: HlyD family efflux transporter periplasmic adaptor subunit [Vicinamibacterales bacterium]
MRPRLLPVLALALICATGCNRGKDAPPRASGYVEATEVRVAGEVGGRLLEVLAEEGKRVTTGDVLARVDTSDLQIALRRAQADKDQAIAQLKVVQAGARPEDLRQAAAQTQSAQADVAAAQAELAAATADLQRFEALLQANAGSRKQRDDALTRQQVAQARATAARERVRAAEAGVARLRAGSRAEEIAAARTRVASADVQIAAIDKSLADAVVKSPVTGVVTSKLVDAGETVPPRAPIAVISDLEHAWANVYVDEPVVPLLKLGQGVTLVTDAGQRVPGTISYISPRAEFTPRNVQTADERSKLVYRIKVTVDNREGVLKPGMPVEAEIVQ